MQEQKINTLGILCRPSLNTKHRLSGHARQESLLYHLQQKSQGTAVTVGLLHPSLLFPQPLVLIPRSIREGNSKEIRVEQRERNEERDRAGVSNKDMCWGGVKGEEETD